MPQENSAPVGAPLREAKQAMRTRIAAVRDALDATWRTWASDAMVRRIGALPTFVDARIVLLTAPFRSEWDAAPLMDLALATGKTVVLPRVDEPARMLELCRIRDAKRDIVTGYRGLPEPATHCDRVPASAIDWVLVPGIAFDRSGARLGFLAAAIVILTTLVDMAYGLLDPRVRRSYRWREGVREPAAEATQTEPSPALAR